MAGIITVLGLAMATAEAQTVPEQCLAGLIGVLLFGAGGSWLVRINRR